MVGEETAAVAAGKDAGEAPLVAAQGADIEDVDDENVARLGAAHLDRAAEDVDDRQVDVADVVGTVVVLDLAVGPVLAFHPKRLARIDGDGGGDVRVPAVVADDFLFGHRLLQVDREERLGHGRVLLIKRGTGPEIRRSALSPVENESPSNGLSGHTAR